MTSILLFTSKKAKLNKQKNEEIEAVKNNTEAIREIDAKIQQLLHETAEVRVGVNTAYAQCAEVYAGDYSAFSEGQKKRLGALVNQTKALSSLLGKQLQD